MVDLEAHSSTFRSPWCDYFLKAQIFVIPVLIAACVLPL